MFALVDANNFYVSCERVFQPKLNDKPVLVLSNNDGCVIARSDEVKALGCKMGEPYFQAKEKLAGHEVTIFSSNYTLYGDMSARMMSMLMEHVPNCEVYSIDEAFLYYSGTKDWQAEGQALIQKAQQWLGLPISIGFGATKTLAKAANRLAKQDKAGYQGVCVLSDPQIDEQLKRLPIEDLWGVGRRHAHYLHGHNLTSAYDYKYASKPLIKKQLKTPGLQLQEELRGRVCHDLVCEAPLRKSICASKSFGQKLHDLDAIVAAVLSNVERAHEKLRQQDAYASYCSIFIHSSPFQQNYTYKSVQIALSEDQQPLMALSEAATVALTTCFQAGQIYQKSGVLLWGLYPKAEHQPTLFEDSSPEQKQQASKLDDALRSLKKRYGKDSINLASTSCYAKNYQMKSTQRSPRYNTRWDELLDVK
eukprot:COSAG01_NODE_165_length_23303_cov_269.524953_4_plen_420_part_00